MPRLSKIGAAALGAFGWTSGSAAVTASYLVVAGGGGASWAGGGGAGGYRTGSISLNPTLSYTVTVGAGGAQAVSGVGNNGSDSVFSTITSSGGGYGRYNTPSGISAGSGGSGGGIGGGTGQTAGSGNTPSTSPSQGNNGGTGDGGGGGGGGGAFASGSNGGSTGGAGGAGNPNSISGTSVTYAGGGGGGGFIAGGAAGAGGGGAGSTTVGTAGTANLGGGGGAGWNNNGGNGGSGVVIISYPSPQKFGGGVVTVSGGNTIHTFTTSGTLSPLNSLTASYLIVAGGGAGGGQIGGGGGAGGYQAGSGITLDTNSIYAVTVGAGGTGTVDTGGSGGNSSFSMVSTASVGGGGGGSSNANTAPTSGGSGGGSGGFSALAGGAGTAGQGNAGGIGNFAGQGGAPNYPGGGGGGATGAGANSPSGTVPGSGGAGTPSSISGTATTYATGGTGGLYNITNRNGVAGTANTGNGGEGAYATAATGTIGGNGGSGVVIISYPGTSQQMAGGTVTVAGGNVIHTFTSSGYLTPIVLVNNSLRFRSSATAYLNRTPSTASNRTTWTWSGWVKLGALTGYRQIFGTSGGSTQTGLVFESANTILLFSQNASQTALRTAQVFRDPSAWYHVVWAEDTTQTTASNRSKLYINGVQVTAFSYEQYPSPNFQGSVNNNVIHYISSYDGANGLFDGYLADVNFIDGQALTPNSFGSFNGLGVWQPIRYGGSYGTNGFYLPFPNSGAVTANYLVVAGGGGGATAFGAGGGAGGLRSTVTATGGGGSLESALTLNAGNSYTVTVGAGGTGGTVSTSGTNGGNSVFSTITSVGGGTGGNQGAAGSTGGSGGAGGNQGGISAAAGAGTANQGFAGGTGSGSPSYGSGGGGGAGAIGGTGTTSACGNGGVGVTVAITGSSVAYAGGGGGGATSVFGITTPGNGGNGGGGKGADSTNSWVGYAGSANTGGGGGGGGYTGSWQNGGAGGSGVVIVSYSGTPKFTGGAVSQVGGNTIHTFTSSGTLAGIGSDYSPNGNNWTPNGFSFSSGSTYDSMTDVPTLTSATAANYGTLNPLYKGSLQTISNANLTSSKSSGTNISDVWGNFGMTSGKWYFECTVTALASTVYIGIGQGGGTGEPTDDLAVSPASYYYGSNDGNKFYGNTGSAYGDPFGAGNVIGCAIDMDSGKIWWSKDGTWQASGNPAAGTNAAFTDLLTRGSNAFLAFSSTNGASNSNTLDWNFGQRPFLYTSNLSGFKALNTFNLPTPAIGATPATTANKYFDVSLYTGNGSTQSITNAGSFQPDFVWIKSRSPNGYQHVLQDVIRGTGQTKKLYSSLPEEENGANAPFGYLSSFNSNGFSVSVGSSNANQTNASSQTYVGWQWKANGAGVTNTAGSITSTVSANPTAGFSIVTYTGNSTNGATVGHGLLVGGVATAPSMIIIKVRNASARWVVYQKDVTTANNQFLELNSDISVDTSGTNFWTIASINDTTFGLGTNGDTNGSTLNFVAYCFAPVAGYSAFGSYTGNGADDGTFVFTGFRPRYIVIKRASSGITAGWITYDTARSTYNVNGTVLEAQDSGPEGVNVSTRYIDILSNGFKLRTSASALNGGSGVYIYMAFAESPFKYANAR